MQFEFDGKRGENVGQKFQAGDFLIYQIESGYGLLRLLAIGENAGEKVWHLAAYNEMFLDIETADAAIADYQKFTVANSHLALTNRAFEATQTARMANESLTEADLQALREWKADKDAKVSDLSVRLLLGFR